MHQSCGAVNIRHFSAPRVRITPRHIRHFEYHGSGSQPTATRPDLTSNCSSQSAARALSSSQYQQLASLQRFRLTAACHRFRIIRSNQRKEHEAYAGSATVFAYADTNHLQSTSLHTAAVQIDTNRIRIPLSAASYDNSDSYLRSTDLDCNSDQTRSINQLLQPLSSSCLQQLATPAARSRFSSLSAFSSFYRQTTRPMIQS